MKTQSLRIPSVILVDDHIIFRQGLKSLITFSKLGTVLGEASDGVEFLELIATTKPDLVIMDIDMPNMDGIEATRKVMTMTPTIKIIVFSMFGDEEYYNQMINLGVKGFILKSSGITEVENAISEVMGGRTYFSNALPKKAAGTANSSKTASPEEDKKIPVPWW